MKKHILFLAAFLCLAVLMVAAAADIPKSTVKLIPDAGFGAGVDWNSIFVHYPPSLSQRSLSQRATYKDFVRLSDGRFFVMDTRTYNILVFNADGKFVQRLWKRGRRKADDLSIYNRPEWLSVWADKFLFVSELGVVRVFDLKGREIRHAVIDHTVDCLFPLGEDRVAVAGWVMRENLPNRYVAAVVDLKAGAETVVMDSIESRPEKVDIYDSPNGKETVTVSFPHAQIRSFVRPTLEEGFLAGFSNWPEIEVYDKTGKLIRTFLVKTEPAAMEWATIRDQTPIAMEAIKKFNKELIGLKGTISYGRAYESKTDESTGEHVFYSPRLPIQTAPYFYNLYNDQNGNLLVFYFPAKGKNPVFQVYSPAGEYLREAVVETGDYVIPFSPGGAGAVFDGPFLYAMAELKSAKGPSLRLMKFRMVEDKADLGSVPDPKK
jgi:hypothetical protein